MSGVRNISRILKPTNRILLRQNRSIFGLFQGWFDSAFNKVDEARIKEVGVDRAAAEWVLRCGGGVKWEGGGRMLTDYNALPAGNYRTLKIAEIDGTGSAIMEEGFIYLQRLENLRKITLLNNKYLTDDSIGFLCSYTRSKLKELEVGGNGNITEKGVLFIRVLKELETLKLSNLPEVKNPEHVLSELKEALPNCKIQFPPYTDVQEEID